MSVVMYNDVTLPFSLITNFGQEAVYDESDTNKLYTKFDITANAVFNTNYATTFGGGVTAGMTPAQIMNQVRAALLEPRKTLSVTFAGTGIVPSGPLAGGVGSVDSKNGPHPQSCVVTQLQNTTFLVTYRCITHRTETPSGATGGGGVGGGTVISNRWTETQQLDFMQMSTRTRNGKIIIRSDNPAGQVPDNVRESMAVVGIPIGFLRESSSYTISTNGLELDYSVTDKEVYYMPPEPAFRAKGRYVETTACKGAARYGAVSLTLYGDKATKQSALLQTAIHVAASHILARGAQDGPGGQKGITILESSSLSVDMYENIVSVEMKVRMSPDGKARFRENAGWLSDRATKAPAGSTNSTPLPNYESRGTTNMLVQAAKYYDPSMNTEFVKIAGNLNRGTMPGQGVG